MVSTNICLAGGTAAGREDLARTLASGGFAVIGSFADAGACADAAGSFDEPELVVILAPAQGRVGEADVLAIKRMYPEASAVILGNGATRGELTAFIELGLDGFLPAAIEPKALAQSLRVILLGEQLYVTGSKPAARVTQSERRAAPRTRTIRRASILIDGKAEVMDSMVLDMSATGAKIRPANIAGLPTRFELRCGFGQIYRCEIVRRSAFYLGVQFVDAAAAA